MGMITPMLASLIIHFLHDFSDEDVDTSIVCSLKLSEVETLTLGEPPVPAVVPRTDPPSGMKLLRKVQSDDVCISICHHDGYTFVGYFGGRIDRIDAEGVVENRFMKIKESATTLRVHNGEMYCLMWHPGRRATVWVLDMETKQLQRKWDHKGPSGNWGGNLDILNDDQIAIGSWSSKQIITYSRAGEVIRRVNCPEPLTKNGSLAKTSPEPNTIIISDMYCPQVLKMSLETGKCIWRAKNVTSPCGVTMLNDRCLLVASKGVRPIIYKMDTETGRRVFI